MARNAKKAAEEGNASKTKSGNFPDPVQVRSYLDRMHNLSEENDSVNAEFRSDMNALYDEASSALGETKGALKTTFKKERALRKETERAKKLDAADRASLERLAASFGDTPMAGWLNKMAHAEACLV